MTDLSSDTSYRIPYSAEGDGEFVRYNYDGEDKVAVWGSLSNGMRLNVTVPVSETKGDWQGLILNIMMGAVVALVASSLFLMFYTRRITRPLEQLTKAAELVEKENYDFTLSYDKDDEIGRLTRSFKKLSYNVKTHISSLNGQVFVDALTHMKNKGAFSKFIDDLQEQIDKGTEDLEFAIGVFDCDSLKVVNDRYGHDKGDIYLKTATRTICDIFKHSPVFRIGGDEFTVILKNDDYRNMDLLLEKFDKTVDEINASAAEPWEQVWISKGFAVYNKTEDITAVGVIKRADKLMYENKRDRKKHGERTVF